jgi:serine/threonine protein phosphatase 1
MGRLIAIGDIHGHARALRGLLDLIGVRPDDEFVFLGDLIDRGPESAGVLHMALNLSRAATCLFLMGNHEEMLLAAADSRSELRSWKRHGGIEALESWGLDPLRVQPEDLLRSLPGEHVELISNMRDHHETANHLFVHAGYRPGRAMSEQSDTDLRWAKLPDDLGPWIGPTGEIKTVWCGHTPQRAVLDRGHLVCLDTGCGLGGVLSAMDVHSRTVWQVEECGRPVGTYRLERRPPSAMSSPGDSRPATA